MRAPMSDLVEVASGLAFPEGPIAMADGSVVLVEMFGPRLHPRASRTARTETIAEIAGGPNGAAVGPGGLIYVCNNGGRFTEMDMDGLVFPGPCTKANYIGGRIQTVDPSTGDVTDLYTECNGNPLWAPNDLVFDAHGGFYFTDHGLVDDEARIHHLSGIYYAKADGSAISEVVFPTDDPNGIGLSPDGSTLYWAETWRGRILQRSVIAPGELVRAGSRRHVAVPLRVPRAPVARLAGRRQRRERLRGHDRQRWRVGGVARR